MLGALYVGGFVVEAPSEHAAQDALRAAGAGDSKGMSASRRRAVRDALVSRGTGIVRHVTADAIDAGNLNALEEAEILALIVQTRPEIVHIDALGHPRTLPATELRLATALAAQGLQPTLHLRPKADRDVAVVGAASLFAKVARDDALDALREAWGALGSGYPSDPVTRRWLQAWAATGAPWPDFVRTRWQTVADLSQVEAP